jgi:hypothetical protein
MITIVNLEWVLIYTFGVCNVFWLTMFFEKSMQGNLYIMFPYIMRCMFLVQRSKLQNWNQKYLFFAKDILFAQ